MRAAPSNPLPPPSSSMINKRAKRGPRAATCPFQSKKKNGADRMLEFVKKSIIKKTANTWRWSRRVEIGSNGRYLYLTAALQSVGLR